MALLSVSDIYQDYSNILEDITTGNSENIYEKVMNMEDNRINLLNRVAEKQTNDMMFSNLLTEKKPAEIIHSIIGNLYIMFIIDLIERRNFNLLEVFYHGDRKIYTGFILVLTGFLLFFIDISK